LKKFMTIMSMTIPTFGEMLTVGIICVYRSLSLFLAGRKNIRYKYLKKDRRNEFIRQIKGS